MLVMHAFYNGTILILQKKKKFHFFKVLQKKILQVLASQRSTTRDQDPPPTSSNDEHIIDELGLPASNLDEVCYLNYFHNIPLFDALMALIYM